MLELLAGLNFLGLGGVAVFLYYLVKGLRERIDTLTVLAEEQRKTLDVVRERASELDHLRRDYRQALDDFQDLGNKLEERRRAVISDLETANKQKDEELARLKNIELQEIELKSKSLEKVTALEQTLGETIQELQRQVTIVMSSAERRPRFDPVYLAALTGLLARGTGQADPVANAALLGIVARQPPTLREARDAAVSRERTEAREDQAADRSPARDESA